MDKFVRLEGLVAPLDRSNVDTDAIIPEAVPGSRSSARAFGPNAFDEWRFMDVGQPAGSGERLPRARRTPTSCSTSRAIRGRRGAADTRQLRLRFSREHAPWALLDFGFRAIIAESYADIFFNNCFRTASCRSLTAGGLRSMRCSRRWKRRQVTA